jgi:hypothetical protein
MSYQENQPKNFLKAAHKDSRQNLFAVVTLNEVLKEGFAR